MPFTQSQNITESYRWFAPELCYGKVVMSTASDVYSFSMTVIEVRFFCLLHAIFLDLEII
jgi:hypothetical protein